MIPGKDEPISPLTMRLVADAPLRWRSIPCIFNRKCKAIFERALSQRNAATVSESWLGCEVDERFHRAVSDLTANHLYWSQPLFVPQDECFVLFRFWQRGIADCMEREGFILDLESLLGLGIPGDLKLPSMTYGEFLEALAGLGNKAKAASVEPADRNDRIGR